LAKEGISVKDDSNKSTDPKTEKKGVGVENTGGDKEKHGIGAKLKSAIHKD
jgi:hypothetical protein